MAKNQNKKEKIKEVDPFFEERKEAFALRLSQLRINKGVSARDMSLTLGRSAGYINNIENQINLPTLSMFLHICEYLEITPSEFFDYKSENPTKLNELRDEAKRLSGDQIVLLIKLLQQIK